MVLGISDGALLPVPLEASHSPGALVDWQPRGSLKPLSRFVSDFFLSTILGSSSQLLVRLKSQRAATLRLSLLWGAKPFPASAHRGRESSEERALRRGL